jgi:hypothetical protein
MHVQRAQPAKVTPVNVADGGRAHELTHVALYQARYGHFPVWSLDRLLQQLAGAPVDLYGVRRRWRACSAQGAMRPRLPQDNDRHVNPRVRSRQPARGLSNATSRAAGTPEVTGASHNVADLKRLHPSGDLDELVRREVVLKERAQVLGGASRRHAMP